MPTFQFSLVILLKRCPVSSPAIKSKGKTKTNQTATKKQKPQRRLTH